MKKIKIQKIKKRAITLIEIMIVISLIAIIGGVLSYNLKGALDKGKAFKTEQAQNQIKEALQLVCSEAEKTPEEIANDPKTFLEASGMVKKPDELIKDGWGAEMIITYNSETQEFEVLSDNLKKYNEKKDAKLGKNL